MVVKKTNSIKDSDKELVKKSSCSKYPNIEILKKLPHVELPNIDTLKKNSKLIACCSIAFLVGFGTKALLTSPASISEAAIVDVQKVINLSPDVVLLRHKLQQRNQELEKWLVSVRKEVSKQNSQDKKNKLKQKYDAEFAQKKQHIRQDYLNDLKKIDTKLQKLISMTAKAEGFQMIFPKNSIIDGGVDITDKVLKIIQ